MEWRTPAQYTPQTQQIIANNMEQLIHIIGRVDAVSHPSLVLPHFVIGYETRTLENSYHWIQVWIQNYNDWYDGVKSHANDQELTRRENSLNKLIKTSHKRIEDYPRILANWASVAGNFPVFTVKVKGISMSCSEYWESLIIKCANANTAFGIPSADLNELIEHCEDEIEGEGSIYSRALMKYLRAGREMAQNYLGLPVDLGFSGRELTSYRLLDPANISADEANVQNMIDSAPEKEPKEKDYPNKISYLKAKGRWIQKEHALTQMALKTELGNKGSTQ